jgi:hypothetical protein
MENFKNESIDNQTELEKLSLISMMKQVRENKELSRENPEISNIILETINQINSI